MPAITIGFKAPGFWTNAAKPLIVSVPDAPKRREIP
jgi:hypothetical protein